MLFGKRFTHSFFFLFILVDFECSSTHALAQYRDRFCFDFLFTLLLSSHRICLHVDFKIETVARFALHRLHWQIEFNRTGTQLVVSIFGVSTEQSEYTSARRLFNWWINHGLNWFSVWRCVHLNFGVENVRAEWRQLTQYIIVLQIEAIIVGSTFYAQRTVQTPWIVSRE